MADRERRLKILHVEDDPDEALEVERAFTETHAFDVDLVVVDRLLNALVSVTQDEFDAVLLDLTLPDGNGLESVVQMVRQAESVPVIILSNHENSKLRRETIQCGAQEFLVKGSIDGQTLARLVDHAVERHRLQMTLDANMRKFAAINAQFRSLIADNADAMVVYDGRGIVRFVNPAAEGLFGRSSAQLVGAPHGFPAEEEGASEIELMTANGQYIFVDMRVMTTLWEGEKAYLATLRDISERKREERALQSAKQMAEHASEMKSAFLANMSHELRTPLNSIIGFADMLQTAPFGPVGHDKYLEYAEAIHGSGRHLLTLINDLLDLSKAEAGKLELHESEFELQEAIRDCVATVALRGERAGLRIISNVGNVRLYADEFKLKQVVLNLLTNAVKFTPRGGEIELVGWVDRAGGVTVQVRDNGVGIPSQDVAKVFATFVQSDHAYVRSREGTGLGLSLSKVLMELQGGTILIESEVDLGTTVSITLPPARVRAATVLPIGDGAKLRRRARSRMLG